ncbi:hypothetical protein RvY_11317 [Ramazzottius varieornatus]|uniref:Uncharacterized protein n=1 Tax=Ramazzottius varieornatus TaxID=947166 RepID=A0A1D1VNG5_RAMVA|nr:hypothetical protein RvY_11317 [Ramazzottius varieornatus]
MKDLLMFEGKDKEAVLNSVRRLSGDTTLSSSRNPNKDESIATASEFSKFRRYASVKETNNYTDEIALYLSLPPPPSTKTTRQFWKEHASDLRKLHALALNIFDIQASSLRQQSGLGNVLFNDIAPESCIT